MGDQRTILFIARIAHFSDITIWITVTAIHLEDTLLGTICTRPPIRVLRFWKACVTLALAEVIRHIATILTPGLSLSAAGITQKYATVFVAWEEIIRVLELT